MPVLPELFVAVASMVLLIAGVFRREDPFKGICNAALVVLVVAFVLVVTQKTGREVAFGGMFVIDGFGRFGKALVLIGSALTLVMSQSWLHRESAERFE